MTGPAATRLPAYVLTGFLGSGKTTLLRHCLASPAFADTLVLVNEFGDVGLDHELLEASEEEAIVLEGGCICCTVREDLAATVRRLADLRRDGGIKPFSRLVIETSGLADPVPVLVTLRSDSRITQLFEYCGAIVAVDAVAGRATLGAHVESVRQVIYAGKAVITKCDLAEPEDIAALESVIRDLNESIEVQRSDGRGLSPEALLDGLSDAPLSDGTGPALRDSAWDRTDDLRDGASEVNPAAVPGDHLGRFRAFSWAFDHELDWAAFGVWLTALLHAHGVRILRVKGILNVAGAVSPVAVHGVQHTVYPPRHMREWRGDRRDSRLVFVVEGIAPERIRRSFDAFHALGERISEKDHRATIAASRGRSLGGRPLQRPRAAAWLKG